MKRTRGLMCEEEVIKVVVEVIEVREGVSAGHGLGRKCHADHGGEYSKTFFHSLKSSLLLYMYLTCLYKETCNNFRCPV